MILRRHIIMYMDLLLELINIHSFHWIEAFIMFSNSLAEIFIFPIPYSLHRIYEL